MNTKNILLIEDCMLDAILIKESLQEKGSKCNINLFDDGFEALIHLENTLKTKSQEIPNLIIANEDLIHINGENLLNKIKSYTNFFIPVIILTSKRNIDKPSFNKNSCCYISKPLEVKDFIKVFQEIKHFWLTLSN